MGVGVDPWGRCGLCEGGELCCDPPKGPVVTYVRRVRAQVHNVVCVIACSGCVARAGEHVVCRLVSKNLK